MPRPKGKPKTGGRAKGVKNKTTTDLKAWVYEFVTDNLETFKTKFNSLKADEQIMLIIKLLPYILPKQMEGKISMDEELTKVIKESMDKINGMF
jgi:CRISPR/Cas system CSM-associated protein Csm2 small subunit